MITELSRSQITGIGAYLPAQIVTSAELMREIHSNRLGYDERLFERATGIAERRFSNKEESFLNMALNSSRQAIDDAGIHPLDIDYTIYCGIDKELAEPSLAHEISHNLGASRAICFDVNNACLGLLNGYSIANAYIATGAAENVLICTAEKSSKVIKSVMQQINAAGDKSTLKRLLGAFTLGDAGGAFIVSKAEPNKGAKVMNYFTDSSINHLCSYAHKGDHVEFVMDMENISEAMIERHSRFLNKTYEQLGWQKEDVSAVYCHQVGAKPHRTMANLAGVNLNKVPTTYKQFANITSATFAVNMAIHRPKSGDKVLMLGAGSGCSGCQIGMQF